MSDLQIGQEYGGGRIFYLDIVNGVGLTASANNLNNDYSLSWHEAIQIVVKYSAGGFTDWVVPSKDELNLLLIQSKDMSNLWGLWNDNYWSSSSSSDAFAWLQRFPALQQSVCDKNAAFGKVRAIRKFAIAKDVELPVAPEPHAEFSVTMESDIAPAKAQFKNHSIGAIRYEWAFGQGLIASREISPSYSYANPGVYDVTLAAIASNGRVAKTVKTITIKKLELPSPKADVTLSTTTGIAPLTVKMENKSQNAGSYIWFWGDDSSQNQASHTYEKPGTYIFSFTAIGLDGKITDKKEQVITITEAQRPVSIEAPGISFFKAYPNIINRGESSELRWETFRAETITLNGTPVNGRMVVVSPIEDTIYTLEASNDGGKTVMQTAVKVIQPIAKTDEKTLTVTQSQSDNSNLLWIILAVVGIWMLRR